ncbi:MAG TPA: murein L,D-transpeptidase [Thermopetrobacter sp.]|nr:murein L,D-transpeptidase [Thermopetrobacter sp.]
MTQGGKASISTRRDALRLLAAGAAAGALARPAVAQSITITNFNRVQRRTAHTISGVVADSRDVWPIIDAMSERRLEEAIARYELIARSGGWPRMPRVRRLPAYSYGRAVEVLRQRLIREGWLDARYARGKRYDKPVIKAVQRFQRNMGLQPSGHVDARTRAALDVTVEERLDTLYANLPRVAALKKGVAARYIVVNIPATLLETVEGGRVYSRHNVIVGMPDRPSPSLISKVSQLNFNPYWNAPRSIVIRDIIPKAQKDWRFLKQMGIRIFDGYNGPEVDPARIDWNTIDPKRYFFRQDPGKENAMATVKINFNNRYAVYLHDTPTKNLFRASERYFSSGCVRIEKVHTVTEWILRDTPGWNAARIAGVVKSGERIDVKVVNPPSVIMAYLTAWVSGDGNVHFRDDIYRLDGTGFVIGQPKPVGRRVTQPG